MSVAIIDADAADAAPIAALHAASWRATYRGVLPDDFLDGPAMADRLQHWHGRLRTPVPGQIVLKAVDADAVCGFACAFLDADAVWGALVDNLHVVPGQTSRGIGQQLLDATFARVRAARPSTALHLWVVVANAGARRFYERNGGRVVDQQTREIRPGISVACVRYAWVTSA